MKNKIIILVILLLLFVSIIFNLYTYSSFTKKIDSKDEKIQELEKKYNDISNSLDNTNNKYQRLQKEAEEKGFDLMTKETLSYRSISEVKEAFDKKETFILVISQTGCSHCAAYLPDLEKILKDSKRSAYVVDIVEETAADKEKFKETFQYNGTPTTFFIKNGEILNELTFVGSRKADEIKEKINQLYE